MTTPKKKVTVKKKAVKKVVKKKSVVAELKKRVAKKKVVTKTVPAKDPERTGEKQVKTDDGQRKPGTFPPGVSGNPNGRPKGRRSWAVMVREHMQKELVEFDGKEVTAEEMIIHNIMQMALKGSKGMIELIWAYIDGKPNQPMDLTHTFGELDPEEKAVLDNLLNKNTK